MRERDNGLQGMSADFVNQTVGRAGGMEKAEPWAQTGCLKPSEKQSPGIFWCQTGGGRARDHDGGQRTHSWDVRHSPAIQTQLQADSSLSSLTHTDRETEACSLGKTTREALCSGQQGEGEGGTGESHTQKTGSQCKPNTESDISRPRF